MRRCRLRRLCFSFMAAALGLRIRRGGRSIGVLLTLAGRDHLLPISLLGESLARVGTVSPYVGPWLATVFIFALSLLFLFNRIHCSFSICVARARAKETGRQRDDVNNDAARVFSVGLSQPDGRDTASLAALSFIVCFVALAAIFNIFTLFELWRFIAVTNAGAGLVARYLLFLLPLITVELFPATMLISVLVTYALLAKRQEAIAWWASGQSVYRLDAAGIFLRACGCVRIVAGPGTRHAGHKLKAGCTASENSRWRGARDHSHRRQWLASTETRRFYSYEFAKTDD